jgi:carbonic anhydrase
MASRTPRGAWRALKEGNARFVSGGPEHPNQDADRRALVALGQDPFVVMFGCSDSRVAAEIVFDQGLGDLFVVRTAGHVVDAGVLGSIEYAVCMLNTALVVVLGHDHCGAVLSTIKAHVEGTVPGGYVRDIVERVSTSLITTWPRAQALTEAALTEAALTDDDALDDIGDEHIRHTCDFLVERSQALAERIDAGTCAVIGLSYHLDEGLVRLVRVIGDVGDQPEGPKP